MIFTIPLDHDVTLKASVLHCRGRQEADVTIRRAAGIRPVPPAAILRPAGERGGP